MTAAEITATFNRLFAARHNTRLCGGAHEPYYQTSCRESELHEISFRHDYASSALHEIAHWCISGKCRRQQDDYGYWYMKARGAMQQAAFELVESGPQALEWIFSVAAGVDFRVSCDNFDETSINRQNLRRQVHRKVRCYARTGLPDRAALLADTLAIFTGVSDYAEAFQFERLPQ